MPSKLPRPTEAELAILRVIWASGPLSVRGVQAALQEIKPTGYTTALKLMQIMTTKGLLVRDDDARPQMFRAGYSQEQTQHQLLRHLVQGAFGGSVRSLVLQALSTKRVDAGELRELENLLDRIENQGKKK